jgi:hypothetical protein
VKSAGSAIGARPEVAEKLLTACLRTLADELAAAVG